MTSKMIKELVENEFRIEDIAMKNRSKEFLHPRYVYYALCREFCREPLRMVSGLVGHKHCTALHAHKMFDTFFDLSFFAAYREAYCNLYEILKYSEKAYDTIPKDKKFKLKKTQIEYEQRYSDLIKKTHKQVSTLKRKNKLLNEPLFFQAADLPEEDFEEFKGLARAFLSRKKAQHNRVKWIE